MFLGFPSEQFRVLGFRVSRVVLHATMNWCPSCAGLDLNYPKTGPFTAKFPRGILNVKVPSSGPPIRVPYYVGDPQKGTLI